MAVRKRYTNFDEVADDTGKLDDFKQDRPITATRDPKNTDRFPEGTLWLNTSSGDVFIRFPPGKNWRKWTTT